MTNLKDLKNRLIVIFGVLPVIIIILYINLFNYFQIFILMLFLSIVIAYELTQLFKKININILYLLILIKLILFSSLVFFAYSRLNEIILFKKLSSDFLSFLFIIFFLSFIIDSIIYIFTKNMKVAFLKLLFSGFIFNFSFFTPMLVYFFYITHEDPFFYLLYFLIIVWSSNSFAYIIGMSFKKRHKVGLNVSPNKSYEGYIGALIFGTVFPFIIWKLFLIKWVLFSNVESFIIIVFINIFTMIGDLFESLIKRFCKSKDSSNLFKGHGGILDMLDSIIFTFPLFYFIITSINI